MGTVGREWRVESRKKGLKEGREGWKEGTRRGRRLSKPTEQWAKKERERGERWK